MLELERKGSEVFCNGNKLKIISQSNKGPGKEVVKVEGLEGSNSQKWVSLSRLKEGLNTIECKGRQVISNSKKYQLTKEEQEKVAKLQSQIDEIVNKAKERYVPVPNLKVNIKEMTEEQKRAKIEEVQRYLLQRA